MHDAHPTYICTGFSTCAYASFYVGIFLLSTQVYRMHRLFFSYISTNSVPCLLYMYVTSHDSIGRSTVESGT